MAERDQFLGEIGNNPFRPTIPVGRNRLDEGRYLGDPHLACLSEA